MSQQHQNKTVLQQYMCEHIEEFDELSNKILWALAEMELSFVINSRGVITLGATTVQESDYPIINETFNKYIQDKKLAEILLTWHSDTRIQRAQRHQLLVAHFCNCFDSSTAHFIRLEIMSHLN